MENKTKAKILIGLEEINGIGFIIFSIIIMILSCCNFYNFLTFGSLTLDNYGDQLILSFNTMFYIFVFLMGLATWVLIEVALGKAMESLSIKMGWKT